MYNCKAYERKTDRNGFKLLYMLRLVGIGGRDRKQSAEACSDLHQTNVKYSL
jgi:hypothetical protein